MWEFLRTVSCAIAPPWSIHAMMKIPSWWNKISRRTTEPVSYGKHMLNTWADMAYFPWLEWPQHGCKFSSYMQISSFTEHRRFEITLSQSDDLRFAVSHFKLIKVPQTAVQYNLHAVGSKIILEIMRRVGSSLPQKRSMTRRRNKKSKAPKPGRPRTARTGGRPEAVELTENGRASLEIGALQDDYSSGDYIPFKPTQFLIYSIC